MKIRGKKIYGLCGQLLAHERAWIIAPYYFAAYEKAVAREAVVENKLERLKKRYEEIQVEIDVLERSVQETLRKI